MIGKENQMKKEDLFKYLKMNNPLFFNTQSMKYIDLKNVKINMFSRTIDILRTRKNFLTGEIIEIFTQRFVFDAYFKTVLVGRI